MTTKTGELVWFDIPVNNFETAKSFYDELLNWKFEPMGDEYLMIKVGKDTIGGLRKEETPRKEMDMPVIYFAVDKLASAVTRAKKLGAHLVGERVDIPDDMGCFQLFRDKDKNLLGLWAQS